MNESNVMGGIAIAMQFLVAAYALKLNRCYGTARVGWSLFGAFSLLALLQLIQSSGTLNSGLDDLLKINGIYVLISFLLLVGMMHLEGMLKERSRIEALEKQMRAELEAEVKLKTAYLTRAIDELMQQMEETKRMSAIIQSSDTTHVSLFDNAAPAGKDGAPLAAA
jgi:hypothetical protein